MAKATIFVLVLIALGIAAFLMYGDEINELIDPTPAAPVAVEVPANPASTKK
tara:strand:+ start:1601 stop:1756 length:156 start_codon:yes stop_codon:yes gene_type:complete